MENAEILKALRELQGSVDSIDRRAAGPHPVPSELKENAVGVDPQARSNALGLFTEHLYTNVPPTQWTAEHKRLLREQCDSVLKSL